MIEQTLINETLLTPETEKLPKEKKTKRKRYVKRCRCKKCGKPKHYICLEHHPHRKTGVKRLLHKIRYNSKRLYFYMAKKLNLVE